MWRLLSAEFRYNWLSIAIPSLLVLVVLLANLIDGWSQPEKNLPGSRTIMMSMAAVVFMLRMMLGILKEKRDRRFNLLPVSMSRIAFSRLFFVLLVWAGYLILYLMATSLIQPYQVDFILIELLSATGFILAANAIPFIQKDIVTTKIGNSYPVIFSILYTVLVLAGTVFFLSYSVTNSSWAIIRIFLPIKQFLSPIISFWVGSGLLILIGVGLTFFDWWIFKHRRSFVE